MGWQRLRVFHYEEALVWPLKKTSTGRLVRHRTDNNADNLGKRLVSFFHVFSRAFETLKLDTAPCCVLEQTIVMRAVARMPHLAHVILPVGGWSSINARRGFVRNLQRGVTFELHNKSGMVIPQREHE